MLGNIIPYISIEFYRVPNRVWDHCSVGPFVFAFNKHLKNQPTRSCIKALARIRTGKTPISHQPNDSVDHKDAFLETTARSKTQNRGKMETCWNHYILGFCFGGWWFP